MWLPGPEALSFSRTISLTCRWLGTVWCNETQQMSSCVHCQVVILTWKVVFFTVCGSPVWGTAARLDPRPGQSDVSPASSGWATPRPAAAGGAAERHKHPLPPAASSLSPLHACFQEGYASCVMEWWMRGGRGGWYWKEKGDRERGMDGHGVIWGVCFC